MNWNKFSKLILSAFPIFSIVILVAMSSSFWISCSNSSVAGVETTNGNTVVALLPNGSPAKSARISFLDQQNWAKAESEGKNKVAKTMIADTNGKFFVSSVYYEKYNVQIDAPGFGQFIRDYNFDSTKSRVDQEDTARLVATVTLNGVAKSIQGQATRISIAGSDYSAEVNAATGSYTLTHIPAIPLDLFVTVLAQTKTVVSFGKSISPNLVNPQMDSITVTPNRILVDDFSFSRNTLSVLTGGASWFNYSDLGQGGTSTAQYAFVNDPSNMSGHALQFLASISHVWSKPYAGCGLFFGPDKKGIPSAINLSKMQSFEFSAKADTTREIEVFFVVNTPLPEPKGFHTKLTLTNQWQTFVIPSDSFTPNDSSLGTSFKTSPTTMDMNRVQFNLSPSPNRPAPTVDSAMVLLGNLYFNGINAQDL